MSNDAGFLIGEKLYPFAGNMTFMDAPLVREVTGLEFADFAERADAIDENSKDFLALTGLLAIAVSRVEPSWSRAQIIKFLGQTDITSLDIQAPDEGDAGPPEQTPETDSPGSSEESITSPEASPAGAPV